MFFLILSPTQGIPWFREIGWFIGFIYLLCAAMRPCLLRYVITNPLLHPDQKKSSGDFVGLPVPAAATRRSPPWCFSSSGWPRFQDKSLNRVSPLLLPFLMLLVAMLMMSTIRYPSGKKVDFQTRTRLRRFAAFIVFIGLVVFYKEVAMLCTCLGYIFYGLIRHWRRPQPPRSPPPPGPADVTSNL